jgi:hypothetical protein
LPIINQIIPTEESLNSSHREASENTSTLSREEVNSFKKRWLAGKPIQYHIYHANMMTLQRQYSFKFTPNVYKMNRAALKIQHWFFRTQANSQSVTEINMMHSKIEDKSPLRNIKLRTGSFDRFEGEDQKPSQRMLTEQDAAPSTSGRMLRPPPLDLSSVNSRPSQKRETSASILQASPI